jgi:hypothetical protein
MKTEEIKEMALDFIKQDKVEEAAHFLVAWGNENKIHGSGSDVLMKTLMDHCKGNQFGKVSRLFHEFMPRMYPFVMEKLLMSKLKMHARFLDNRGLQECFFSLPRRWVKKGWIRPDFDPVKHLPRYQGREK